MGKATKALWAAAAAGDIAALKTAGAEKKCEVDEQNEAPQLS